MLNCTPLSKRPTTAMMRNRWSLCFATSNCDSASWRNSILSSARNFAKESKASAGMCSPRFTAESEQVPSTSSTHLRRWERSQCFARRNGKRWLHYISKQGKMYVGKSWGRLIKCVVSLIVVDNAGVILLLKTIWVSRQWCVERCRRVSIGRCGEQQKEKALKRRNRAATGAGMESNAQRHQIAMRYITRQNSFPGHLEHHRISSFVRISEAAIPQTLHFHYVRNRHFSHCLRLVFVINKHI